MYQVVPPDDSGDGESNSSNTMIYLVSAGITAFLLVLITLFVAAIVKAKNR